MSWFGKSEAELNDIAKNLDARKITLDNLESSLKSKELNLAHQTSLLENAQGSLDNERTSFREEAKQQLEGFATERASLEERRITLAKLEAEAKVGFVATQREVFRETIEKRIAELDARQQSLNQQETALSTRFRELHTTEGHLAKRELAVTEREQKADAGFADKAKALANEITRQHQANLEEAARLRMSADALADERQKFETAKAELLLREQAILAAEQKRDTGFVDERAKLDRDLRNLRMSVETEITAHRGGRIASIEEEMAIMRNKRLEEISKAEKVECERIRAEISEEREAWSSQLKSERNQLESERSELEKKRGECSALQSELEGKRVEQKTTECMLELKEKRLEQRWAKRNDDLNEEVAARVREECQAMESELQSCKSNLQRLRESLRIQSDVLGSFEQLKRQLGGRDAAEVIRDLNVMSDEINRLREELKTSPTEEIRKRYQEMESEAKGQKARIDQLEKLVKENTEKARSADNHQLKNSMLVAENQVLAQKASLYESAANEAHAELTRLRAAFDRSPEVVARVKEIENPHVKRETIRLPEKNDTVDELTWLTGVGNACDKYGLHFHPRILRAFHTALKTAEWSPLTILAGVSGTGKSELPRLYSHFGGLVFEPLSVQPNWDSQESMLGFFNSIDNKFDAQPVLRFLAQSQKDWIEQSDGVENYPGLKEAVCLILLDEMNLAHPELYFAEFLSKLELRRGMKGTEVPHLPVKLGAGMPAYPLPMGRNVLWAGTMNQDETTKALSDKVQDRSIIIHFPRPTDLKRRLVLTPLDDKNRGPLLHRKKWHSWVAQGTSFSEEDVKPYKDFIQTMNKALAVAGRAIGHRVWQSVEYYMANYPDVRAAKDEGHKDARNKALHAAFEDQLVQKVMPKLRGIDTRGKCKTECLDVIRGQINSGIGGNAFNLADDFEIACDLGHGQFIWQSANYLREELRSEKPEVPPSDNPSVMSMETKQSDGKPAGK